MWLTNSELEVIEGVFVDNIQLSHQSKRKLYHGSYVHILPVMLLQENTHQATLFDKKVNILTVTRIRSKTAKVFTWVVYSVPDDVFSPVAAI